MLFRSDVIPVGIEVQADKVLYKSGCAHALPSEVADNPVQLVTHISLEMGEIDAMIDPEQTRETIIESL